MDEDAREAIRLLAGAVEALAGSIRAINGGRHEIDTAIGKAERALGLLAVPGAAAASHQMSAADLDPTDGGLGGRNTAGAE
jgi:hypothetical protein